MGATCWVIRLGVLLSEEHVANASRRVGVMVRGRWYAEPDLQRGLRIQRNQ